jgi:tetratricopeptide (TPR) repeat protein
MSIRGLSPIVGLQKMKPRPPKSGRTHSEKRFTPQINKSFTCYSEAPNLVNQSFTVDKPRNTSLAHLKPRNTPLGRFKNFRSIPKLSQKDAQKKDAILALYEKAEAEIKNGDFKAAIFGLNRLLKEEPGNPRALYLRGKCYISMQSYKEAIPDLLGLVQEYPMFEKNAYVGLAMSFVAVGDYGTAVRQLSKAVVKFPKFKEAYLARAQLLGHQKIWEKAISDLYKAISLDPDMPILLWPMRSPMSLTIKPP